jgi:hypothetical protein
VLADVEPPRRLGIHHPDVGVGDRHATLGIGGGGLEHEAARRRRLAFAHDDAADHVVPRRLIPPDLGCS